MKFQVIIPMVQQDLCNILLNCMKFQDVKPDRILIINNSGRDFRLDNPMIEVFTPIQPLNVNPSWNLAIKMLAGSEYVSFLNDDISFITKKFFEEIENGFHTYKKAGVVCPETINNEELHNHVCKKYRYSQMRKREGWAFTIRKSILDNIPPIPDKLTTFCGDDWIWHHCHKAGYYWLKAHWLVLFHRTSSTVKPSGKMKLLKTEKNIFQETIRRM